MFINQRKREINLKIVYYGPALSGKTTNLQYIHAHTHQNHKGDLISLKTREDRTVFFDYLMLELGQVAGLKPKFNLYTVPGQVYYASTRKLVLQGADGVVFVVDSRLERLQENLTALRDMAKYMREVSIDPRRVPIVLQFNKRDLPEIAPVSVLRSYLGVKGEVPPCIAASALHGEGVFDTLKLVINRVIQQVQNRLRKPEPTHAL
ncbi:MAG: GTP-binding protein [Anaerolineales bacterium]